MAASPVAATYGGNTGRVAFGAFDANDRSQADIWSTRPGDDDVHRLTDPPGRDICPAYSPDGKHIAFCSDRTGAFEIWVMDANGKDERQVTALGTSSTFPDFSPDGGLLPSPRSRRVVATPTCGSCRPTGARRPRSHTPPTP